MSTAITVAVQQSTATREAREVPTRAQLRRSAWTSGFRRAIREFLRHGGTDLAAALTFFSVLGIFPGLLAVLALLGVISDGQSTSDAVVTFVDDLFAGDVGQTLQPYIVELTQTAEAGWTFVLAILGALWTASAYVRGFGRAMNRVYQVPEGRSVIKLRVQTYLLTIVTVAGAAFVVFSAAMSGPIAREVGDLIGLGEETVQAWDIAKWPVILIVVILMVALLYYATPNVRHPRFRWLSLGATIAILGWILASAGFAFYFSNFSNYNRTYGSLAGVIIVLLWLWLTNIALVFGGVVDAEVERARELQAGIKAERRIQLEPRDTAAIAKKKKAYRAVVAGSRELRQDADIRARAKERARARV